MIDQKKYIHLIEMYRKVYRDVQKEKGIPTWAGTVAKCEKRSGTVRKDYHWDYQERAAKFHNSSKTFWTKAVLQGKISKSQLT